MFIRLLVTHALLLVVIQAAVTNSSNGQTAAALTLPKQAALYDDYDLNDKKTNAEGSGSVANLDEYADEEEDNQLSKFTDTTIISSTSTTTKLPTTKIPDQNKKNTSTINDDLNGDEFKEDYADDLQDDNYYNEVTSKSTIVSSSTTRQSSTVHHHKRIWILFSFLTRPPIAAGILAGLAIGILISVILLICIVRRFHQRERSHSSYTRGLLYPNQYGYSKSPQEFYA